LWPRVNQHERKAVLLEARIPVHYHGAAVNPKPVLLTEVEPETVLRNVIAAITAALRPSAMSLCQLEERFCCQGLLPLPAALLCPSALLLQIARLLLGSLSNLVVCMRLLLLGGLGLRLLMLSALLLGGPGLPLVLLCGLGFLFMLCIDRSTGSEKQE